MRHDESGEENGVAAAWRSIRAKAACGGAERHNRVSGKIYQRKYERRSENNVK